jgi:1,4-dihydroxy-2-naphthoate octaprenyltransferase
VRYQGAQLKQGSGMFTSMGLGSQTVFVLLAYVHILLYYIHSSTPLPQYLPLLLVPALPLGSACSSLLFSDFLREKEKIKCKNGILASDKGSYTGRFLVIFPCMYVL